MTISYAVARDAPLLAYECERVLIQKWQEQRDQKSLEKLVISHARLVFQMARKLSYNNADQEEMIAEGLLGLINAADVFDLKREVRFSTYARWWVRNSVFSAFARLTSVVDAPAQARREDGADLGRPGLDSDELDQMECPDPNPEEQAMAQSHQGRLKYTIAQAVTDLAEIEREIVMARSLQADPTSMDDLSQRLGISRDRLRQIERRAISKLKYELLSRGITSAQMG